VIPKNKLVLSANNMNFIIFEQAIISLILMRNKSGPKMDPCGTPHEISCLLDIVPNQFRQEPLIPYNSNFFKRMEWLTVSKALDKSIEMPTAYLFSSRS